MTDFPQLAAGRKQNQIDTDCRLSTQPKVGIDWAFWAIDIKHDDEIGLRQHLPQNALMCFCISPPPKSSHCNSLHVGQQSHNALGM